jgi:hypothetical protein
VSDVAEGALWHEVRVAWNAHGLGISVEVHGKRRAVAAHVGSPEVGDGIDLWIDTRDTRDVHRATRFCHHFQLRLAPRAGGELGVRIENVAIHRAMGSPGSAVSARHHARAWPKVGGWLLEWFLPAEGLSGYDPEINRRLGICYEVRDAERGSAFLTVGREFPIAEDPSLWSTLELVEAPGGIEIGRVKRGKSTTRSAKKSESAR